MLVESLPHGQGSVSMPMAISARMRGITLTIYVDTTVDAACLEACATSLAGDCEVITKWPAERHVFYI